MINKKKYWLGKNNVNEFCITTRSAKVKDIKKFGFCQSTIDRIIPIRR